MEEAIAIKEKVGMKTLSRMFSLQTEINETLRFLNHTRFT